jgi:hypothetical protein
MKPTEMTYDEYVQSKSNKKWLRLRDCSLSMTQAMYARNRLTDTISQVYIPVRSAGDKETETIHCLLATKDPKTIEILTQINSIQSESELLKFALENPDALFMKRDIQGLVRFGIEMKDKEKRKLEKLGKNLAPDFIVLDEGQRPNPTFSFALFLGGAVLAGWIVWGFFQKPAPPTAPPPVAGPSQGQPPVLPNPPPMA